MIDCNGIMNFTVPLAALYLAYARSNIPLVYNITVVDHKLVLTSDCYVVAKGAGVDYKKHLPDICSNSFRSLIGGGVVGLPDYGWTAAAFLSVRANMLDLLFLGSSSNYTYRGLSDMLVIGDRGYSRYAYFLYTLDFSSEGLFWHFPASSYRLKSFRLMDFPGYVEIQSPRYATVKEIIPTGMVCGRMVYRFEVQPVFASSAGLSMNIYGLKAGTRRFRCGDYSVNMTASEDFVLLEIFDFNVRFSYHDFYCVLHGSVKLFSRLRVELLNWTCPYLGRIPDISVNVRYNITHDWNGEGFVARDVDYGLNRKGKLVEGDPPDPSLPWYLRGIKEMFVFLFSEFVYIFSGLMHVVEPIFVAFFGSIVQILEPFLNEFLQLFEKLLPLIARLLKDLILAINSLIVQSLPLLEEVVEHVVNLLISVLTSVLTIVVRVLSRYGIDPYALFVVYLGVSYYRLDYMLSIVLALVVYKLLLLLKLFIFEFCGGMEKF